MPNRLNDKVAIITGGSTGIGKGIAEIFIKEGAKVCICSRNTDMLNQALEEIKSKIKDIKIKDIKSNKTFKNKTSNFHEDVYSVSDENIIAIKCDVSNADDVKNLVFKTVERFGKLNVLINNAGKNPHREFTIETATEDEWGEFIAINAKGSFLTSKYAIPEMRKAGGGSIIMISSISAHIGQANVGVYNSSKAAQEGLVRSMAVDFAKDNIRVNAICPGWVMVESLREPREKIMDYIKSIHPIGRIGTPEDIAWAAVYLASDESSWVTGASFAIDGGYTAV